MCVKPWGFSSLQSPRVEHQSLGERKVSFTSWNSQSTPPFYNLTFYYASFWEGSLLNRSKCENSILRKRYYSFKHSGNSRGRHRGPEIVSSDWQTGRKMSEFSHPLLQQPNFLKIDFGCHGSILTWDWKGWFSSEFCIDRIRADSPGIQCNSYR